MEDRVDSRASQVRGKETRQVREVSPGRAKVWRCAGSRPCGPEKPSRALRTLANSRGEAQPAARCPPVRGQVPPGR